MNTDGSKFLVLKVAEKSLAKNEADSGAQGVAGSGVTASARASDRTSDSNCSSWPIKLKFGETTALRCLMMSKASSSRSCWVLMMYAMQMVGEREMPASQWTRTFPPDCFI